MFLKKEMFVLFQSKYTSYKLSENYKYQRIIFVKMFSFIQVITLTLGLVFSIAKIVLNTVYNV